MSSCLKIGDRILDSDQIISSLVQYQLLESLIGQLLLDDVIQEVPLSKQELFHALGGSKNTPLPEDFDGFLAQWCQQENVTWTYFKGVLVRNLRIAKFKQLFFAHQVESEFLRTKADFDQVEYSLIQVTDLPLAQELYFQLRDDGTDFGRLAQQYSLGNERQTGGRIGPVSLSSLPKEVTSLFHSEQIGVVQGPVEVNKVFGIVRLDRFAIAHLTDAIRNILINQMYDRWLQARVQALMTTSGAIAVQTLAPPTLDPTSETPTPEPTQTAATDEVLVGGPSA
jgi:parvulin-like peptidyl-prolyl isomerase